jgi:P4 family phage/plasmid primase-like protien
VGEVLDSEEESRLVKGSSYYSSIGWNILPCHGIINGRCTCGRTHGEPKEVGKHPVINQWNSYSTSDSEAVKKWWGENPDYNIGVHCSKSGFFVIDIDPRSGGPESFTKFIEQVGEGNLPATVEAITGTYSGKDGSPNRGRHLFYKCDPEEGLVGHLGGMDLKGIDIKHNGYVLIAPSRHFSGVSYEWADGRAPWEIEMAEAPEALLAMLRKKTRRTRYSLNEGNWDDLEWDRVDVSAMLEKGINEGSRAVDVYKLTCALANKIGTDDVSRQVIESEMVRFNQLKIRPPLELEELLMHVHRAVDFVADNPKIALRSKEVAEWMKAQASQISSEGAPTKYKDPEEPVALLGVVSPRDPDSVSNEMSKSVWGMGQTIHNSIEQGNSISEATSLSNINVPKDPDALDEQDGGREGARSLSDIGNGRRLVDTFGAGTRYTSGLGWFVWKNGYWKPDTEDLEVQELAKKIPPIISSEVVHYSEREQGEVIKWAQTSRSNSRLKNAIESAKSDPRVTVPVEHWDKDDNLLGVLNGVIDLRTGDLLKGQPDLHITRRAPVSYTRGHRNSKWEEFLDYATHGDKELQEWLQKAAGYSLTGSSKYDIMFLVYGPPGSGKNTFVEALVKVLGTKEYAWPLDSTILAHNDSNSGNTDLYHWAQLRGRRIVWVDELPESERIKENAVKKLTGSSEISARSPGEQPFTFQSKAKLWISTNNRPIITDDAMWRRIRPIPFTNVPTKPDPNLKDYIFDPEGALPAVLSWAVEGAVKLLNSREPDALGWCKVVSEAAEKYRKNEDRIGLFLVEETTQDESAEIPIKRLYEGYRNWAMNRGERPMTQIGFHRKLSERGLNIRGDGTNATLVGYQRVAQVPQGGNLDYSQLHNQASGFAF